MDCAEIFLVRKLRMYFKVFHLEMKYFLRLLVAFIIFGIYKEYPDNKK